MRYKVTITETLSKDVEVEAESLDQAEAIVERQWKNSEHVLDADCFSDVNFYAETIQPEKIRVILLEPGKVARDTEIGTSLEEMQRIVGGMIETAYFFDDPVVLVVNDEGKINGMPRNRGIRDKDNNLVDIIAGTAFLCGDSGSAFTSLSDKLVKKYSEILRYPEHFFRIGNEIKGVQFKPEKDYER